MDGRFGRGGGSGNGVEGAGGYGPAGATLSIDGGGGGSCERAIGDGALIGSGLDG